MLHNFHNNYPDGMNQSFHIEKNIIYKNIFMKILFQIFVIFLLPELNYFELCVV